MSNIIVIGSQWGDEGKGKIVDLLCEKAEIIVRFQGGHNAGHTLVVDSNEFKLSLLPSGIIRENKLSIIGNGVVVDPLHFIKEIEDLKKKGIEITSDKLKISESCFLILPIHKKLDNLRESIKTNGKIGTTGRGIGPAYEDKIARRGLRIADFSNTIIFKNKLKQIYDHHNIWLNHHNAEIIDFETDFKDISSALDQVSIYKSNIWSILNECVEENKHVLFEGAQGTFLDIDFGTYPYVTSSNTISGNALIGSGIGLSENFYTLGIAKAYTTRVGNGPFPTEVQGAIGELIAKKGKEFGTVTGRKRRCGWLDLVLLKQSIKISGICRLALTKLDVLDNFKIIKICVGYEIDGNLINYLPVTEDDQIKINPIYKEYPGWDTSTYGVTNYKQLPHNAKKFLSEIESIVGCRISIISTGPDRNHTIMLDDIFDLTND